MQSPKYIDTMQREFVFGRSGKSCQSIVFSTQKNFVLKEGICLFGEKV